MRSELPVGSVIVLAAALFSCHAATKAATCQVNGDCADGSICADHVCTLLSVARCGAKAACSLGKDCPSHACQDGCCLTACTQDAACDVTETCDGQACRVPASTACAQDADCANPSAPHCDASTGTCSRCIGDDQCPAGSTCQNHGCRAPPMKDGCTADEMCPNALPYCLTAENRCVLCVHDRNCGAPGTATCDQTTHVCHAIKMGCDVDIDCTDPARPRCRTPDRTCVACTRNTDCPTNERCLSDNTCASESACVSAVDCHVPNKFCDAPSHLCVACESNTDCPAAHACMGGQCQIVGCLNDTGCHAPTPHCQIATHNCVQCFGPADCPGNAACNNGTCAAAPSGCSSDAGCAGMAGTPRCNTSTRACVQCVANGDCGVGGQCVSNACMSGPVGACNNDASCGGGQVCAAVPDPSDPTNLVNRCTAPVGIYFVGTDCKADADCQSGRCIGMLPSAQSVFGIKGYCQGGCVADSDCPASSGGMPGACELVPVSWTDSSGQGRVTSIATCAVQCRNELACASKQSCGLVENVAGTAWVTRCQPETTSSNLNFGGADCSKAADCSTGLCYHFGGTSLTGMCLGVCDPNGSGLDCSILSKTKCDPNGVLLPLSSGAESSAQVCWGKPCTQDSNCPTFHVCRDDPDPTNPSQTLKHCRPQ